MSPAAAVISGTMTIHSRRFVVATSLFLSELKGFDESRGLIEAFRFVSLPLSRRMCEEMEPALSCGSAARSAVSLRLTGGAQRNNSLAATPPSSRRVVGHNAELIGANVNL